VDSVTQKPIFRPLIGMDKTEIIEQSINIGTYSISILPDQDCCTLFVPKHPVTRSNEGQIQPIEADLDVERLVALAMGNLEIKDYD
jgi:thiamine biosynthesis protein ThiI